MEGILYRNFSLISIPISSQDFQNLNNKINKNCIRKEDLFSEDDPYAS